MRHRTYSESDECFQENIWEKENFTNDFFFKESNVTSNRKKNAITDIMD